MECVALKTNSDSHVTAGETNLTILKKYYKEAFKFINEGLNLEDKGKNKEAVLCYKKGLRSLTGAKTLPNGETGLTEDEANTYKEILAKITRAQKEVLLRLETLDVGQSSENQSLNNIEALKSQSDSVMPSAPPLYPEIPLPSTKTNEVSKTNQVNGHHETKNAIQKDKSSMNDTWQDVKELLKIEEGVRLFHVDDKGDVSTWVSPCVLNVFQILKESLENISPAAFMKCGEWVYPMEPGKSPVLRTTPRTYMFPDVSIEENKDVSQMPCVGVVLSEFVPDAVVKRFERILSCYCDFRKEVSKEFKEKPKRPPPPAIMNTRKEVRNGHLSPTTGAVVESDVIIAESGVRDMDTVTDRNLADKISAGISVGSQWISWGLVKGAEYTGILVEKGAATLREKIKRNEVATAVDEDISNNIRQLHQATGSVVQVSAFLVSALGTLTVNIGKKLAPHVMYHGQQLLPDKYKVENNEGSQKKLDEAKKVAAAGLHGFGLIYLALEQAGMNLYKSISSATVETVQHKYGEEVGDVTQNVMGAAGNTLKTYWNVKELGVKAIAKRAAKDTGKAMVLDKQEETKAILQ